ncbi:ribonuclease H-like domain-containing protein [Trametes punicea]|nr:ribonuclease H-like domain-containing protein [Trametes punicea]
MSTIPPALQMSSSTTSLSRKTESNDQSPSQEPPRVYDVYSWSTKSPQTRLVYIQNVNTANKAISQLDTKVLGFDLEWKPNYIKGMPENPVALVQLASEHLILLIHVSYMCTFPEKLRELLADATVVKAGVGIQKDCKKLYYDHGVDTRNCVDLSLLARTVDNSRWKGNYSSPIGLSRLCETYEERTLQKGRVQRSNWELPLDLRQQQYAANDCHAGLTLYTRLAAMAAAMSPIPDAACYTFDAISGFLYQPSSGVLWHPFNPFYDPGPPPPPRPPKANDGNVRNGAHSRGHRSPRRGRPRHPEADTLSPSASAFVPGAEARSHLSSRSAVAGFAPPRHVAGPASQPNAYTRSSAPRQSSSSTPHDTSPKMEVDEDGFPRMGRVPRGYQGNPDISARGANHIGHSRANAEPVRGRGRGRGRSEPVSVGFQSVAR